MEKTDAESTDFDYQIFLAQRSWQSLKMD